MKISQATLVNLKSKGVASFRDAREKKPAPAEKQESGAARNAAIAAAASMEASDQIKKIAQSIMSHLSSRADAKPTSYKFTINRDERTGLISSITADPVKKGE